MKNIFDKLSIKDGNEVVNLIKDTKIKQTATELYVKSLKRRAKIFAIIAVLVISLVCIGIGLINKTNAYNEICQSSKCEARKERIIECQKFSKNKDDVLQCSLWKTIFSRQDEVTRHEKEEIKEELKNLQSLLEGNLTNDKVEHNVWEKDDIRQEYLNKFYIEAEKQGVENIKDMLGTFLGENGKMDYKLRSYIVGANGYYDYGLCQINKGYHKAIVNDERFFTDVNFQIEQCVKLYKGGTVFYGARHKEKMKKYLTFNK